MGNRWVSGVDAEEACYVSGASYRVRELVELALEGKADAIANTSIELVFKAELILRDCVQDRCPFHEDAHDALDLLSRITDEPECSTEERELPKPCEGVWDATRASACGHLQSESAIRQPLSARPVPLEADAA